MSYIEVGFLLKYFGECLVKLWEVYLGVSWNMSSARRSCPGFLEPQGHTSTVGHVLAWGWQETCIWAGLVWEVSGKCLGRVWKVSGPRTENSEFS